MGPLDSISFPKVCSLGLVWVCVIRVKGASGVVVEKLGSMQKLMLTRVGKQRSITKSIVLFSPE